MANGKGSAQRPLAVSPDEYERRWEQTFGKQDIVNVFGQPVKTYEYLVIDEVGPVSPDLLKALSQQPPTPPDESP